MCQLMPMSDKKIEKNLPHTRFFVRTFNSLTVGLCFTGIGAPAVKRKNTIEASDRCVIKAERNQAH